MIEQVNLRQLVRRALEDSNGSLALSPDLTLREWDELAEQVSFALVARMRHYGLAIHLERACVRLPPPPGRPMTIEEQTMVGLLP